MRSQTHLSINISIVTDLENEEGQKTEILKEYNRANRNSIENKTQLLTKFYFEDRKTHQLL